MRASKRAAYPDLCTVAVEQFKLSPEFQMAIDTAVAKSIAREGEIGVGPSNVAAVELVEGQTKGEIIQNFQQSDYYKHKMSQYWDSGWVSCQRRAAKIFLDIDTRLLRLGEEGIAQTLLDEGIDEEELMSGKEEGDRGKGGVV
ncbi:hypothetical protein CsSME_00027785 [Camellia sinensis var. sinensis]